MADRLALVIAVESYQDPAIAQAVHAERDAGALADVLERLGFARDKQILLVGSAATKTAVESRLRKLVKAPPTADVVFCFYAGHGVDDDDTGYLTCFDSLADDLPDTGVPLSSLLEALFACRAERTLLFLDDRAGIPLETLPAGIAPHLPSLELEAAFAGKADRACFVSSQQGESSHSSGVLKAGVWAHLLVEALAGRAPLALEDGRVLTAGALQEHLAREVPRALRTAFREGKTQTPWAIVAREDLLVADVGPLLKDDQPGADPRLQQLTRGCLRVQSKGKVKLLSGYRKSTRVPDKVNAYAQKLVADLAAEDIKSDVERYYNSVREHLGYKRRDVEGSSDRGSGFVRTPDFEYSVRVELLADDPTTVVWTREVANIRNPEVVLGKGFGRVFGDLFDTLVFEFVKAFDLESWVDRVEELAPEGVKLRCASDCSSCDIHVAGFTGVIRLHRDRVEISGRKEPGSKGLVEAFLQFQDTFGSQRDLAALPLSSPGA